VLFDWSPALPKPNKEGSNRKAECLVATDDLRRLRREGRNDIELATNKNRQLFVGGSKQDFVL
jgi:hypothetical protein